MPRSRQRRALASRRLDSTLLRLDDVYGSTPVPPGPCHADYKIEVKPVPVQAHEPEQWYWHLYFRGERINGGVADYEVQGRERAVMYKYEHHRDVFLRKNFWTADGWESREYR